MDSLKLTSFSTSLAKLKITFNIHSIINGIFKIFNFNNSYFVCLDELSRAIHCQFNGNSRECCYPIKIAT